MSEISDLESEIKLKNYIEEKFEDYLNSKEIKLTEKQNLALKYLSEGRNVFLTGPAGTGKSLVISLYKNYFSNYKTIALTSTTGISATLIKGVTLHSYLGIGLGTQDTKTLINKIQKVKHMRKKWENLEILIIDEISMLSPELFDKIEEIARIIRFGEVKERLLRKKENNNKVIPFGGIQLLISGDFLQLPPVKCDKFCFEAKSWNNCIDKVVYFTENLRQNDYDFQDVLNNIRLGIINKKVKKLLKECSERELKNQLGIKPTLIYSTNYNVDLKNEEELDELCKQNENLDFFEYNMEINIYEKNKNINDIVDKFKKSCLAPENIQLCIGAQVMLIKNLEVESGLANGSRGIVINFTENKPVVKFLNGEERIIDYHTWDLEEDEKKIIGLTQIPLKLAWAVTTHKSQGMTLDYAEVDMNNFFDYGQVYVALSRVKTKDGLKIINLNYDCIKAHPKALEYYNNL